MEPETLTRLGQFGPLVLGLIALILFLALALVLAPRLMDFWTAGSKRDSAMAEELPLMRGSLQEIATNTKLLQRMDEKLDGIDDKLNIVLGRRPA